MSLGDLAVFNALDLMANPGIAGRMGLGDIHADILNLFAEFGRVTALHGRVKAMPRVMNYIKKRPAYPF